MYSGGKAMDIKEVIKNIKHINHCLANEFAEEVAEAFTGYEYDGETDVIVDRVDALIYGNTKVFSAFVNHQDAPIVRIEVEKSRGDEEENIFYHVNDAYVMPEED